MIALSKAVQRGSSSLFALSLTAAGALLCAPARAQAPGNVVELDRNAATGARAFARGKIVWDPFGGASSTASAYPIRTRTDRTARRTPSAFSGDRRKTSVNAPRSTGAAISRSPRGIC